MVEGARRASKHTQSREEWWRGPGGQPNAIRAGRSGGGSQEGSQTHSESGGVVVGDRRAAKRTQSREESIGDATLREKERERERERVRQWECMCAKDIVSQVLT